VRVESAAVVLRCRSCSSDSREWKTIEQRVQVDGLPPRWCPPLVYVFGLSRPSPLRAAGRHPLLRWRPICLSALLPLALCKPTADAAASRMEQARKIRTRLGGSSDLLEPFPAKPKGMLRRTFQRLRARAEASMYGVSHSIRYGDIVSVEASNSELASARFIWAVSISATTLAKRDSAK
jgi:hypothetical protein